MRTASAISRFPLASTSPRMKGTALRLSPGVKLEPMEMRSTNKNAIRPENMLSPSCLLSAVLVGAATEIPPGPRRVGVKTTWRERRPRRRWLRPPEEKPVQKGDPIGDVDRAGVVRVRGLQAG